MKLRFIRFTGRLCSAGAAWSWQASISEISRHSITEQIWSELNGSVLRSKIQEVQTEVIPRYEEAQIHTFVPIFIHRDAVNRLRSMQTPDDSPVISEANASTRSHTRSGPASSRTANDDQDTTKGAGPLKWKQVFPNSSRKKDEPYLVKWKETKRW